jgi:hypothetical protein
MLRQFLIGGGVSLVNIAIRPLLMTSVVQVAQGAVAKWKSHPSLFLVPSRPEHAEKEPRYLDCDGP